MPELPEVEIVTRALRPHLSDRMITGVEVRVSKLRSFLAPERLAAVVGREIIRVRRRAKYIIIEFAGQQAMVIHLGMSGSLRVVPQLLPPAKHEHLIWSLDNGLSLRFNDPRRFGMVDMHVLGEPGAMPEFLLLLPPEPLDDAFSATYLTQVARGRRRPVKSLLMDNRFVVGVGNIYANEALFRAALRPTKPAGTMTGRQCAMLVQAIKEVLREAIAAGGTTISDFASVDGSEGRFARQLFVYGRVGESCPVCRQRVIVKEVLAGRSTYYCPRCQR
ncbi:MAG: bifunctional DNA-formamidopyrimidine glycosylase/DNA-(apurinic or apyrimidinic site) lyase [Deltaproteobacteria bacterium]|nr:bifunctional DNA-formamidopyrimidine glycosylase/DNA-(apurinic or apyrimidinic site) lyase [Candidatus Anaeroferrophillus wilburensis]MBN2889152.1 bifunctional DNA-formamidopyrimidine glycosylase/DNA-(apurinic or apyrimidinic site) lyase [Deltaproteobacteria bacterium]